MNLSTDTGALRVERGLRNMARTRHICAEEGAHIAGRVVKAYDHHTAPALVLSLEFGDA